MSVDISIQFSDNKYIMNLFPNMLDQPFQDTNYNEQSSEEHQRQRQEGQHAGQAQNQQQFVNSPQYQYSQLQPEQPYQENMGIGPSSINIQQQQGQQGHQEQQQGQQAQQPLPYVLPASQNKITFDPATSAVTANPLYPFMFQQQLPQMSEDLSQQWYFSTNQLPVQVPSIPMDVPAPIPVPVSVPANVATSFEEWQRPAPAFSFGEQDLRQQAHSYPMSTETINASSGFNIPANQFIDSNIQDSKNVVTRLVRTSSLPSIDLQSPELSAEESNRTIMGKGVKLEFVSDLDLMTLNWSLEEEQNGRRLVWFRWCQIEENKIQINFQPISQEDYQDGMDVMSCIKDSVNSTHVFTSVEFIAFFERLAGSKFRIEEKNRIRRNLQSLRSRTVTRENQDRVLFSAIMGFGAPKPRNIEKNVKVFKWEDLSKALEKVAKKYSIEYSLPIEEEQDIMKGNSDSEN